MRRMGAMAALLVALAGMSASGAAGALSVVDYGARGDGKADDAAAFQRAMDECAGKGGGIVSVPSGKYLIRTHLNVPAAVTLEGVWCAPPTVNRYHDPADPKGGPELKGSVLLAVEGAGKPEGPPFISLNFNSTLKGLTVFYPEQTKTNPPVAYPWTVASAGADNCAIVDVLLVNPYQAVDFGTRTSGRHYIRNLYAQALYRGLFIDQCLDIGRVENVHFWPFWTAADADSPVGKFTLEKGEAFIVGRTDWEYLVNCFAISYQTGFRFVRSKGTGPFEGGGNVLLTQSGADMCEVAVLVDETQGHSGVSFANSQIFGDIIVQPTNAGEVRFTGCGLFGSIDGKRGVAQAKIAGSGRVSFSNCHFYAIHPGAKAAPHLIRAESGRLSIIGCSFINSEATANVNSNPIPIVLEPDVRVAIIVGNEFRGKARIVNRARGRVQIANNVEESDTDPFPKGKP